MAETKIERNWEIFYQRMCGETYQQIADNFNITKQRVRVIVARCAGQYYFKRRDTPLGKSVKYFSSMASVTDVIVRCHLLWHGLNPWNKSTWIEYGEDICGKRLTKKYLNFLDAHEQYMHLCLEALANPSSEPPTGHVRKRVVGNTVIYSCQ